MDVAGQTQNLQPVEKAVVEEVSKFVENFGIKCSCYKVVSTKSTPV
jgi:hypothetical protein